jgi:hypothetical protein
MNISKRIAVAIFSIFSPIILVVSTTTSIFAATGGEGNIFHDGRGSFSDGKWSIYTECGEEGTFLKHGDSKPLRLFNESTQISNGGKKTYTWVQKGARYKLRWNPNDSGFARLEIVNTSGIKIVNTLLKVDSSPPC